MIIENKTIDIAKSATEKMRYAYLIIDAINQKIAKLKGVPVEGLTINQMRGINQQIDKLEPLAFLLNELKTDDEIQIDDPDFATIKEIVSNCQWSIFHNDLIVFEDYLNGL